MEDISCPVCFNIFLAESTLGDRKPNIICANGHTVCRDCYVHLDDNDMQCPSCRSELLSTPIINRALLDVIENYMNALGRVPEINITEITMSETPFAGGAFAEVYDAKWHNQDVAVKVMRPNPEIEKQVKALRLEANLAIGLHHPNIVRLFGTTQLSGNRFGIVMEKADNGSLDSQIRNLELQLAVTIALGVIDGLDYVHSKKVAHRDLKPHNILLCGPQMIPKIADFGVSKVIQTVITNSAMVGTPKYAAPELLSPGSQYGCPADIFSLSVILFEMFSGLQAEQGLGSNVMQIMLAVVQGKRPKIPADFPDQLKPLIERGWAQDPKDRTSLGEFRSALQSILRLSSSGCHPVVKDTRVSLIQQSAEVAKVSFPLPVMSLKWNTSCEVLNSQELRIRMVEDIKTKSNMAAIINDSVLSVLKVIPRHLFVEEKRLGGFVSAKSGKSQSSGQQGIVNAAYLYNRPIPATMSSNESSPEIIGTQLSMTEIIPGQSVLLVGMKGGYIQSLVAQLVGINGSVVTVTSDVSAMNVCRDRVQLHSPLKQVVHWVQVSDAKNASVVRSALQQRKMFFHTVVYCGSVAQFPKQLFAVLNPSGNVSIMAPVKDGDGDGLRFQLYQRHNENVEMRTITDFGVLFEEVH